MMVATVNTTNNHSVCTKENIKEIISSHMDTLTSIRRHIHANPELSGAESKTSKYIINFFQTQLSNPPQIIPNIGGHGFVALFDFNKGAEHGKTVVFRCELDALSCSEKNDFPHKSTVESVSHKCGHDGHMAILVGLGVLLSEHCQFESGRVALLFQPAEETGTGARDMVHEAREGSTQSGMALSHLLSNTDHVFALHNLPQYRAGTVVMTRTKAFASASKGMHVSLTGSTSHASQPHLGRNPAVAMSIILQGLLQLPTLHIPFHRKALVTIVGAHLGPDQGRAYGVSAGHATVMATLRTNTDDDMLTLTHAAESLVAGTSTSHGLKHDIMYEEEFHATVNNKESVEIIERACGAVGVDISWNDDAFPWSEDFGIFLQNAKGAMFGLGVGEECEHLHSEYYDFPDKEIMTGMLVFFGILDNVLC